jgi:hypothetical protein
MAFSIAAIIGLRHRTKGRVVNCEQEWIWKEVIMDNFKTLSPSRCLACARLSFQRNIETPSSYFPVRSRNRSADAEGCGYPSTWEKIPEG